MELSIKNNNPTKSFTPRRLPRNPLPPEEIARRKAERAEFGARCRVVFEKLRPQLIDQHYNWFIAVNPDNDEYLIDPSFEGIIEKVREPYKKGVITGAIFRLNEQGFCGRI